MRFDIFRVTSCSSLPRTEEVPGVVTLTCQNQESLQQTGTRRCLDSQADPPTFQQVPLSAHIPWIATCEVSNRCCPGDSWITMPDSFGVAVSTSARPSFSLKSILEQCHHCLWLHFIFIYFTPKSVAQAWPSLLASAFHSNC